MSEPEVAGRLTGKTTTHEVQLLITNPNVERNNYFIILGEKQDDGTKPTFLLNITEMWSDKSGSMAKLHVLGERPTKPFEMGIEVYLATEKQISEVLGIYNPPEKSVSLGKLIGYPFNVNLLVRNFGRIFITGKSGSGKSYTMGVLCEEFLKKGIPVVIIDRHGEYGSLKVANDDKETEDETPASFDVVSNVCPWCGEETESDAISCEHCGKELESEISEVTETSIDDSSASIFADTIIEYTDLKINPSGDVDIEYLFSLEPTDIVAPRLCTIINLRGLDLEVQELVAGRLLKKLYKASTGRLIPPFYLFLDEAHLFAGKKVTETCEIVKLFAQEGRKFGANIVVGTQRPQLLDVTIRAQSGTWVVHNLSDVRDIGITIQSAEDLSKENSNDISGLDKGQAIVCGEAVKGIPLFVKVRKRMTKHGGIGFNVVDFLSEQTMEGLQGRRDKLLSKKSDEELESSKSSYQELLEPKTTDEYMEEIDKLRVRIRELEKEVLSLKLGSGGEGVSGESSVVFTGDESDEIKELKTQIQIWKEKYNYLKQKADSEVPTPRGEASASAGASDSGESDKKVTELKNKISKLETDKEKLQKKHLEGVKLAEKLFAELKKYER